MDVLRALDISHSMLSRWKRRYAATPSSDAERGFVALPVSDAPSRDEAVAERPSVAVETLPLRLTIRREASGLALSGELSVAQWRAALSLLETGR